ncbi:proline-, glutamic acid- and leucine-rich protein 1-like [Perca fluviatilis]|uniref:proline-, glutamic acid- and leucine-rich protein 1-like n=1 Tax=Perca fluviatilis TaxID=8168 RepID=UPI0019631BBE|nr:proline-, glutamic acid- and leucine-rich protein 1-like [Perca fluviatilis]
MQPLPSSPSDQLFPSTSTQEPSDEELVKAVVDLEKSSDVQAPLSLPQHPPPPPSAVAAAAQKGAGVSAGDEPTNEELLEATQDHNEPLQPPAAMEVTAETPAPAPHPGAASPPLPGVQELTEPAVLPPPSPAGSSELLPASWRAVLTAEQQQWIGRVLFTRSSKGRSQLIKELNVVDLASAADVPPAFVHRYHDKGWAVQRPSGRVLDIDGWYLMATEYLDVPSL